VRPTTEVPRTTAAAIVVGGGSLSGSDAAPRGHCRRPLLDRMTRRHARRKSIAHGSSMPPQQQQQPSARRVGASYTTAR